MEYGAYIISFSDNENKVHKLVHFGGYNTSTANACERKAQRLQNQGQTILQTDLMVMDAELKRLRATFEKLATLNLQPGDEANYVLYGLKPERAELEAIVKASASPYVQKATPSFFNPQSGIFDALVAYPDLFAKYYECDLMVATHYCQLAKENRYSELIAALGNDHQRMKLAYSKLLFSRTNPNLYHNLATDEYGLLCWQQVPVRKLVAAMKMRAADFNWEKLFEQEAPGQAYPFSVVPSVSRDDSMAYVGLPYTRVKNNELAFYEENEERDFSDVLAHLEETYTGRRKIDLHLIPSLPLERKDIATVVMQSAQTRRWVLNQIKLPQVRKSLERKLIVDPSFFAPDETLKYQVNPATQRGPVELTNLKKVPNVNQAWALNWYRTTDKPVHKPNPQRKIEALSRELLGFWLCNTDDTALLLLDDFSPMMQQIAQPLAYKLGKLLLSSNDDEASLINSGKGCSRLLVVKGVVTERESDAELRAIAARFAGCQLDFVALRLQRSPTQ